MEEPMLVEDAETLPPAIMDCNFSFDVTSELLAPYDDPFGQVRVVEPYRKSYGFDPDDFTAGPDRRLVIASRAGRACGYLLLSKSWNGFVSVEDLAVDRTARRSGAGRMLMDRAVGWAREQDAPGIRLETQSNNVAACRFHKRYGFELGGYDKYLYAALEQRRETALFLYLFLTAVEV
ncbi:MULTISPECIES: GNAT family N-acetyltransferase [Rhizobium]